MNKNLIEKKKKLYTKRETIYLYETGIHYI